MTYKNISVFFLALSMAVCLTGCGGKADTSAQTEDDEQDSGKSKPAKVATKKVELPPGTGVLKGKVTFEGELPNADADNAALIAKIEKDNKGDAPHCLAPTAPASDKEQQVWRINKSNKGVANAVVFLNPESGTYFSFNPDDAAGKKLLEKASVGLHQPFCAFEPHVAVLFQSYFDKKNKRVESGGKVTVSNDTDKAMGGKAGGISHNTMWSGGSDFGPGNQTIEPGKSLDITTLKPRTAVKFSCSIHTWMNAIVWVLDTPYFAITDENGNFEIKNSPAGKVRIVAWHEGVDKNYLNQDGNKGETIELKAGENTKDFTASKPK